MLTLSGLPGVPEVPGGADRLHTPEEIGAYAAWLDARINEYAAALTANKATSNGQAILLDFIPWFATWKAELAKLNTDLGRWGGGVGGVLTNPWTYLPGGNAVNPLVGAWDRLRLHHAELIEFARRMQAANLAAPELPGLPTPPPGGLGGGGPSPTTIAIFSAAVGGLGAYLGWQVAPLPQKPAAALAGGILGAGATFLALR